MTSASARRSSQLAAGVIVASCLCIVAFSVVAVPPAALFAPLLVIPALGAVVLVLLRPEWGIVLLLVSFYNPAIAYMRLNLAPWSYALTVVLFVVTLVAALMRRSRVGLIGVSSLSVLTACYLVVLALSAAHGLLSGNDVRYVVSDLVQMAEPAIAFWVALEVFRRTTRMWVALAVTFAVFVPTLIWELFVYSFRDFPLFRQLPSGFIREAFLGSEVVVAAFSQVPAILLPILFAVVLLGSRSLSRLARAAVYLGTALSAVSVAVSFKRSLWAAEAMALLLVLLLAATILPVPRVLWYARRALALVVLVAALLGIARYQDRPILQLMMQRIIYTISQLEDRSSPGVESRSLEYAVVAQEFKRSPMAGRGLGAHYIGYERGAVEEKHFMHNSYLAVLYRTGLVGLLVFSTFFGSVVVVAARRLRRAGGRLDKGLVIGCLASLASLALLGVTGGNILMHPSSVFAGVLLAIVFFLTGSVSLPRTGSSSMAEPISVLQRKPTPFSERHSVLNEVSVTHG